VLTDEPAILDATNSPVEHAIYSTLLQASDPAKWERILKARDEQLALATAATSAPTSTIRRVLMTGARAARWVLAVPHDPDLKTFSRRGEKGEVDVAASGSAEQDDLPCMSTGSVSLLARVPAESVHWDGCNEGSAETEQDMEISKADARPASVDDGSLVSTWPQRNLQGDVMVHRVRRERG
jgi:hypothetical protein